MGDSFAGQFLVATPIISEPPFARTVILLLEHNESGAIGLVLNSPTDLAVRDHIQGLDPHLTEPPSIFVGGPVSTETAISLGKGRGLEFLRPGALVGIGIVDLEQPLDELDDLRIFAGYAGWSPSQLEAELEEGAWWVLHPDLDEIFARDVDDMWDRTVARGPGTMPLHTTYPPDPSNN